MDNRKAVEELKKIVIGIGLPMTDVAFFGVKCPYCGKSDRIRQLESPEDLTGIIDSNSLETYAGLWRRFAPPREALGVCKFCQNPLELFLTENKANPLYI